MNLSELVRRNLVRLREERGLSQTKLAGKAGVNPATVALIESGMRSPNIKTIGKLSVALDVNPARFVEWSKDE